MFREWNILSRISWLEYSAFFSLSLDYIKNKFNVFIGMSKLITHFILRNSVDSKIFNSFQTILYPPSPAIYLPFIEAYSTYINIRV